MRVEYDLIVNIVIIYNYFFRFRRFSSELRARQRLPSVYRRTLYGEGTETPPREESCVVLRNGRTAVRLVVDHGRR